MFTVRLVFSIADTGELFALRTSAQLLGDGTVLI